MDRRPHSHPWQTNGIDFHKQTHSYTQASTGNHTNAQILLEQSKLEILWSLDPGAGHIQLVGHGYLRSHPDCSAVFSVWHWDLSLRKQDILEIVFSASCNEADPWKFLVWSNVCEVGITWVRESWGTKLNIWDSPGSISLTILLKDLLDVASIDLPDSQSLE